MDKYVAYLRVSTNKQGSSGLGLNAQRKAVVDFVDNRPDTNLIEEFVEIESGRKNDRPKLAEAIAYCKKHKAMLLIAKLDRLARNVHFISGLMEAGIEFVAVDNPHANRLMTHLLSAFAEFERECISKRTKEALAQAKARGAVLGKQGSVLAQQNKSKAIAHAKTMEPIIACLKAEGYSSLRAITQQLNFRDVASPDGRYWHLCSVHRLMKRIKSN